MRFIFLAALLAASALAFGQSTITLTEDLVLTETLVIAADVTYEGNGFAIICDGCSPAIQVTDGAVATFNDVRFPKTYAKWLGVQNGAEAYWNSQRMTGFMRIEPTDN